MVEFRMKGKNIFLSKICHTYTIKKLGTAIPSLEKIQSRNKNHVILLLSFAIFFFFYFLWVFKSCFNKYVCNLMMSAKKRLWKYRLWHHHNCPWCYNKNLARDSSCTVDVVMWPKRGKSSISVRWLTNRDNKSASWNDKLDLEV